MIASTIFPFLGEGFTNVRIITSDPILKMVRIVLEALLRLDPYFM